VAEAKKLIAAAGYPNGFQTVSNYVTGPELGTTPNHAEVIDGFVKELGITSTVHAIDYLKDYVPNFRDGKGQWEGWSYVSTAGAATGSNIIGALASEYWSKGGAAFKGFSLNKQNDQSGDPELDRMIEKARVELDTERRRALVFDIQRYLAKPWYSAVLPGYATGLVLAWPALGNYRVWQGGRYASYKWWIDDTKAPLKST
jgi:ABC-type transport system substrate-binding protein